jgi:SAM-dependent methyltransferase
MVGNRPPHLWPPAGWAEGAASINKAISPSTPKRLGPITPLWRIESISYRHFMCPARESLSFDRASDYYDRTRALPEEAAKAVTDLLLGELLDKGRVLEIGVGTGRIGYPLHRAGLELYGVDISAPMLDKLREKPDGSSLPVALADSTRLPFANQVFCSALTCHVLHLIPHWRHAVAELARVVAPGGAVLVDPGGLVKGDSATISQRFIDEIGGRRPGMQDPSELDEAFAQHGASLRALEPVKVRQKVTFGAIIDDLEAGLYSATWDASQEQRSSAAAVVRTWTEETLGDLEGERTISWDIRWRAYDLA